MQISPLTMSHPTLKAPAPPCLPLFIKDPLKEEEGLLPFAFGFLAWALAFGFLVWEAFGREKIAEGKKTAKGEWLKSG
jgi:hypothetical protein